METINAINEAGQIATHMLRFIVIGSTMSMAMIGFAAYYLTRTKSPTSDKLTLRVPEKTVIVNYNYAK